MLKKTLAWVQNIMTGSSLLTVGCVAGIGLGLALSACDDTERTSRSQDEEDEDEDEDEEIVEEEVSQRSGLDSTEWTGLLQAASFQGTADSAGARAKKTCPGALSNALAWLMGPKQHEEDWEEVELGESASDDDLRDAARPVVKSCVRYYSSAPEVALTALECQADADTLGEWVQCRGYWRPWTAIDLADPEEVLEVLGTADGTEDEEGERRIEEEGLVGNPEVAMEKTRGQPENLEERYTDKDIAEEAGPLGAWDDLGADAGITGTGLEGIEGPIGLNMGGLGDQQGGYGFSDRGGGGGGGGSSVDGVGTGTRGRGTGRSGYGEGGGGSTSKRTASLKRVGGEAIILGALDKSLIDKVIKQNQAKFLYCYQRELLKDPELKGKVTLNFTISGDGSVAKSSTYKTTLKNSAAEACMNSVMKQLKFPEPKGGGIVIVKYPFVFSAG